MVIRKTPRSRPRLRRLSREDESNIINSAVDKILFRNTIAKNVEMADEDRLLDQNSNSKEIFGQWSPKEIEAKKSFLDDEMSDLSSSGITTPKKVEKKIPRKNLLQTLSSCSCSLGKITGNKSFLGQGGKRSTVDYKAYTGLGVSKASKGSMKLARKNSSDNKSIRKHNREVKLSKRNEQITTIGESKNKEKMSNVISNEVKLVDEVKACEYKCVKVTPRGFTKNINVISRNITTISDATPSDQHEIEENQKIDKDIKKTVNIQIRKITKSNTDIKKKLFSKHTVETVKVKQETFKSSMKSGKIIDGKRKSIKSLQISFDGWQRCGDCGVEQCDKFRYVVDDDHGNWMCSMHSGGVATAATHHSVFKVGSVVTAGFRANAPWPGMVDFCPDTDMWAWPKSEKMKGTEENYLGWFHVTFFSNPVTRAWIPAARVQLYDDNQGVKISRTATNKDGNRNKNIQIEGNKNEKGIGKNNNEKTVKATRSKASMETVSSGSRSKASKIFPSKKMQVALEMVGTAMKLSRKERVDSFSFINNYKGAWKVDQK